jgi:tetratricopeptide (TPR) repeat protein
MSYYYTREYDKALANADKTLELDPEFSTAYRLRSLVYHAKEMYNEAIAENERWGKLTGNPTKTKLALANIYASAGRKEEALTLVTEILNNYTLGGNDYRSMAHIYTALGDYDEAFKWLDLSLARREESLCNIKIDPKWDQLRDDQRYIELVRKVGLA